ncbi:Pkinase-domain-containing protein [Cucurbitaria berberidis CBS 394.84]|uniref:non-specific serine/threonine protein kinase n=1 Tax=Cucurbitaria berberidis CBS 394.84 TaxID=1168544 RepID=A0A9P4LEF2_9PLEO|nr:Pkinase-domain-containing protein [Cucurbitaria berberidis CBS 394.84]KAF1851317.1 Pkinase-domain-containing protein [Cucurbitaria berberidis CBS 394.84]
MAAVASQPPHGQQYYQQQSPVAASPGSARRPSRRPSNGASPNTPTTPRAQPLPQSTQTSPAMNNTATSMGSGPMPPPRTSSSRAPPPSTTAGGSSQADRVRDDTASAAANAAQSRRRGKDSPHQQGSSSRSQPGHSRSATAVGQPPTGTHLPREESTVINRIVVADPQEDIAREQARQAEGIPASSAADLTPITGLGLVGSEGVDDGGRGGGKSRQDHSKSENSAKRSKFGNYILGQTLGEGEFGKVKMGWKRDSSVEVAIKLIRRETLGGNSNRLQKIYREIHILRGLDHPNIVRLHEMVETERHIGIILEYASGGELFDYILNHRYLKDGPARKLFSQLISGVGYLHRKGIVHRDLKLENLLLDRNKNIIITDFGFANTFDPHDELSEEIEYRLGDKDYIRSMGMEGSDGARRGDLMQTSCGSPCYAAPELVVSDSLYTGRKVDVWSCGVILYAMLAGYLPFDDDPANPEGDNINLLYKYIVSTPLTFPEYVTPHARDLLKRILVPDPRKRADLFEVARHSWLADYSHVVGFITSSNTNSTDAQQGSVYSKDTFEQQPALARSASVREPAKPHAAASPAHGGLTTKKEQINQPPSEKAKTTRDNKRRTVQVEYVAPQSQTVRGEASPPATETPQARGKEAQVPPTDGYQSSTSARPSRSAGGTGTAAPARPGREPQRSVSDYSAFGTAPVTTARPSTGGTLGPRLPSRGNSYGMPSVATVAQTNAEGRFSQPKGQQYSISAPYAQAESSGVAQPSIGQPSTQRGQSIQLGPSGAHAKGHRRSNTVTETLGRMTSMFSGRQPSYTQDPKESLTSQSSYANHPEEKKQKSYPPTSMPGPISNEPISAHRQSTESGRRTSFGFSRKNTNNSGESKPSRRFSLLPSSLSKTFTSQRDSMPATSHSERRGSNARPRAGSKPGGAFGRGAESRSPSQSTTGSNIPGFYDGQHDSSSRIRNANTNAAGPSSAPADRTQFEAYGNQAPIGDEKFPNPRDPHPSMQNRSYRQHPNNSEVSETFAPGPSSQSQSLGPQRSAYPQGMGGDESPQQQQRKGVLQKSRKFADAYDEQSGNKGSSGSSKKVMDFFRRMGRQRTGGR